MADPLFVQRVDAVREEANSSSLSDAHKDVIHGLLDNALHSSNGAQDKLQAMATTLSNMAVMFARHEIRSADRLHKAVDDRVDSRIEATVSKAVTSAVSEVMTAHLKECPYLKSLEAAASRPKVSMPSSPREFLAQAMASYPQYTVLVILWLLYKYGPGVITPLGRFLFGGP